MNERTLPPVTLVGDWPEAEAGYSWHPTSLALGWTGSVEAFAIYSYLITLGYSQDGLSPLPADLAQARDMSVSRARRCLRELGAAGLVELDGPLNALRAVRIPAPVTS